MAISLLKGRRTIRQYQNKPVPTEILQQIIDVALLSPTAVNFEGLDIVVLANKEKIQKISELIIEKIPEHFREGILKRKEELGVKDPVSCDAPAIFVLCKNERYNEDWGKFDAGIWVQSIVIVARELGLETMILGFYTQISKLGDGSSEEIIGVPKGSVVIGVAVGYGDPNAKVSSKVIRAKGSIVQ